MRPCPSMPAWSLKPALLVALMLAVAGPVQAHSPRLKCQAEGEKQIRCEGGFSNGSDAAGV